MLRQLQALFVKLILFSAAWHAGAAESSILFDPPPTRLDQANLAPLLDAWDEALASDLLDRKLEVMERVAIRAKVLGLGEQTILRYNNPELQERVIDMYIWETLKYPKAGNPPKDPEAAKKTNPWLGMDEDYMQMLGSLAESTFSDRIYDYELKTVEIGVLPLRDLYLAKVKPDKTLGLIFNSTIGKRKGDEDAYPYFNIYDAFIVLRLMTDVSPDTVERHKAEILRFIRENALYLSTTREGSGSTTRPFVYSKANDNKLRSVTLDLLDRLGEEKDLALVVQIRQNATDEVRTKAEQVKNKLATKGAQGH